MSYASALKCRECGREYPLDARFSCEFCFGPVEVVYDYERIGRDLTREAIERGPSTLWRYAPLLPADPDNRVDIGAGLTPLVRAKNLGEQLGLRNLYIKNDTQNPTWSFKDRVVSVALTRAREFGFETVACASTGNLANSVAAHAAHAGLKAVVFIPSDLESGKIVGSAIYNPTLVAVEGSYDDVNRLCTEVADRYPWGFVNINLRPYYSEGSKTLGYEVAEQLGWRTPDYVVGPLASGSLYTKIWKGFKELARIGLVDEPRTVMSGAQAQGCAPIATAWEEGSLNFRPVKPKTIARSLAIGNPADGYYALKLLAETGGRATASSDEEIVAGIRLLAESEGVFAETAGGVVIAGLKKLAEAGAIDRDALTVAYITGGGLKTVEAVSDVLGPSFTIKPRLSELEDALNSPPAKTAGPSREATGRPNTPEIRARVGEPVG
ncbi:MAG: threonine synthase [Dehalococcoidia bacterium]